MMVPTSLLGSRGTMGRKVLLACGILSSLLYVAANVLGARRWRDYSLTSHTVSELSAIRRSLETTGHPASDRARRARGPVRLGRLLAMRQSATDPTGRLPLVRSSSAIHLGARSCSRRGSRRRGPAIGDLQVRAVGAGDTCIVAIAVIGRTVDGTAGSACRGPIALSLCRAIARASARPPGRGG
jgi:hypothetical protein